jgi:hypothetical protein
MRKSYTKYDYQVIYIIGAGRSGTTLVDIMLGNNKNSFSCGELNRFTERNGVPNNPRDDQVVFFWNSIRLKLKNYFPRIIYISRILEYHYSLFFRLFILSSYFKKYNKFNLELFDTIYLEADKPNLIIDSGKYPFRAYNLYKLFKNNIKFVYIKRNPLDVVQSFKKKSIEQKSKSYIFAHFYLLFVNILSKLVLKFIKSDKVEIYYEDLVNEPKSTLDFMSNSLSIDFNYLINKIMKNQKLKVGLIFDSNRLRIQNEIEIQRQEKIHFINNFSRFMLKIHKIFWYK